MKTIIKIPKEMTKQGDLILISKSEYEEFLTLFREKKEEEKNADNAIKVFLKEKRQKKLFKINSFKELD